jgi:hypothetical protein
MDPYVLLWNSPYALIFTGVQRMAPSMITPTFVLALCVLVVLQTSHRAFSSAPLWTRALFLYLFLLAWVFLLASVVTQFICGKDLFRLGCSMMRTQEEQTENERNTPPV